MKKSILIILVLITLSFALAGCGENITEIKSGEADNSQSKNEALTDNIPEITPDVTHESALETNPSEAAQSLEFNTSSVFENGVIAMDVSMFAMEMSVVTYYKGDKIRSETISTVEPALIQIFFRDENIAYQYEEGEKTGDKLIDVYEDQINNYLTDSLDLYSAVLVAQADGEDITITEEMLDGERVKYIYGIVTDGDVGETSIVEMWYSEKYNLPLKYEITSAGMSIMALTVTDIKVDTSLDDALFVPPSDIEFIDFYPNSYVDNFLDFDYSSLDQDNDMSDFGDVG